MEAAPLLKTPFHLFHKRSGAKLVPFAGYEMPVQYTGILDEVSLVRSECGLFDVSHMARFSSDAANALELLDGVVTNNLKKLLPHHSQYNLICNEKGGVLDDLIVTRRGEKQVAICANASNHRKDWEWITSHTGKIWRDDTPETFLVALQGPLSETVLRKVIGSKWKNFWYLEGHHFEWKNTQLWISRSGYTGEDGFEIEGDSKFAETFWLGLIEAGARPCGLGARDTLRLEMGYPLYGNELTESRSPYSVNLDWAIKLRKGDFVGKKALEKFAEVEHLRLIAFKLSDRRIPRKDYQIYDSTKELCGFVTSGTFSPTLESSIGLAVVSRKCQSPFFLDLRGDLQEIEEVKLPFVPSKVVKN